MLEKAILVCVSDISHSKFCGFLRGQPLFCAMAVCHLSWRCQVPRARACDWISISSLKALFSFSSLQTHS